MALDGAVQFAILFALGVAAAAFAVYLLTRRGPAPPATAAPPAGSGRVFLFSGDTLVDATPSARALLPARDGQPDRPALVERLSPRFPSLGRALADLPDGGRIDIASVDGTGRIEGTLSAGRLRLHLFEADSPDDLPPPDGHALAGLQRELDGLRMMADHAAVPFWRTAPDGTVTWTNAAYLELARRVLPAAETDGWPPPALFGNLCAAPCDDAPVTRRLPLTLPGQAEPEWYRCHSVSLADGRLCTAIPEDAAVQAERALDSFVQTLSDTFAHLSAGLAIFDRERRLTLFNPALGDLTGLPVTLLARHPTLAEVLDLLREQRMTPEPKDYKTWRGQLADLERAAESGTYSEVWPLTDGRTFRVTGRPHHNGALAFVFEDITAEMAQTRRFRADLATGQAALDRLDEAVAVFSPGGVLTRATRAYAELWGDDPMETPGEPLTFLDAVGIWQAACRPAPLWGDARDFAAHRLGREEREAELRLRDGRPLSVRFRPLAGGATLVAFRQQSGAAGKARAAVVLSA